MAKSQTNSGKISFAPGYEYTSAEGAKVFFTLQMVKKLNKGLVPSFVQGIGETTKIFDTSEEAEKTLIDFKTGPQRELISMMRDILNFYKENNEETTFATIKKGLKPLKTRNQKIIG